MGMAVFSSPLPLGAMSDTYVRLPLYRLLFFNPFSPGSQETTLNSTTPAWLLLGKGGRW